MADTRETIEKNYINLCNADGAAPTGFTHPTKIAALTDEQLNTEYTNLKAALLESNSQPEIAPTGFVTKEVAAEPLGAPVEVPVEEVK